MLRVIKEETVNFCKMLQVNLHLLRLLQNDSPAPPPPVDEVS